MICVRVGDNCLKYLERGSNRKEGREHIDFKKGGGKLGQGVGSLKREERLEPRYECFKKGGATGIPLRTMYNQFLLLKNYILWH